MNRQKRALAVHDISCAGRCSLTVALPILSAGGVETVVLPTSILSTHTGGFEGYTFRDLTDEIRLIIGHWESLGLGFDAIYTGYLGSFEQIALIEEIFGRFGGGALKAVDPVMADNGKLYAGFSPDFPARMRQLCAKADLIIPNITEAVFLLGEPFVPGPYTAEYITGLLRRLGDIGARSVVLTGVYYGDDDLGAAIWSRDKGVILPDAADLTGASRPADGARLSSARKILGYYHGTGDIFGSILVASLLAGKDLPVATQVAVDLTARSIAVTDPEADMRYGVRFEAVLPDLINRLGM